jgi:hypothetical protein
MIKSLLLPLGCGSGRTGPLPYEPGREAYEPG